MAKILLIDDIKFTRDYLERELSQAGHTVALFDGGETNKPDEANGRPDFVIVDPMPHDSRQLSCIQNLKKQNPKLTIYAFVDRKTDPDNAIVTRADALFLKNMLSIKIIKDILMDHESSSEIV
jgi:DNA-binding response OmpR family regulator